LAVYPNVAVFTQIQYLTFSQLVTQPPNTQTQFVTVTSSSYVTTSVTNQGTTVYILVSSTTSCGYPFDPSVCNQGPPVTILGYLATGQSECFFLQGSDGRTYTLYNMPSSYPTGYVRVFGYAYPNWSQSQAFPPYQPFPSQVTCAGIPFWILQGPIQY